MKKTSLLALFLAFASLSSTCLQAQDAGYHPALSDNFIFSIGAFRSDASFALQAQGKTVDLIGSDIDFGESVGVDESSTLANAQLRWKFGSSRKWSLSGQYFSNNSSGRATLEEDVEWQGVVFQEGTFVEAGVKLAISRLLIGRSFVKNEQHDFGIGLGLHNLNLSAYIGGEVRVDDEEEGDYVRRKASSDAPLPNLGLWYLYSPASRWLLKARIDWISANVGDYDGTLWNANLGVNFQATDHFGIDLYYQYFDLDVNVDKSDWNGGANLRYSGPVLGVTFNW
jgi:hypothetical protein